MEQCVEWGEKYQTDCEAKEAELKELIKKRNENLEILNMYRERKRQEDLAAEQKKVSTSVWLVSSS